MIADKKTVTEQPEVGTEELKLNMLIAKASSAQKKYASFSQTEVDAIFKNASSAANAARITLAKQAVEETGMGIMEDKVIKNHFASEYIYNKFKDMKSCGVIERDPAMGIIKVAEPLGVIAGVVPTTNPTSTAIFKALIALKTRNAIIFSPHPRAKNCTKAAIDLIMQAACEAGAPEGLVSCIEEPTVALSSQLMKHPDISLILATGGPGMVKAAYSSGKPAVGVGAGNTPAIIDETADFPMAVSSILQSKTFDNGVICASEQSVIAVKENYDVIKNLFKRQGAYLLNAGEKKKVADVIFKNGRINADIVGQSAFKIAKMAGVKVDKAAKVLIGETTAIALDEPFAHEKLSPILALYMADDFEDALNKADALIELGGLGHTSVLYTDPAQRQRIEIFGAKMKTGRTLVNMPASQGAIGDLYNFGLTPSLTLGCGSWGGNSVSENVSPAQLLNIKTVAERRENMLWFQVPSKIYFKAGAINVALDDLKDRKKAFIVTDRFLEQSGMLSPLTEKLKSIGVQYEVFSDVEPDPTLETVERGLNQIKLCDADTIIAFGGGSPMDAAKVIWLMYENPGTDFDDLAMRFMDIRKRINAFPENGRKAMFVAIPTTSGTGSEVTPFAVITDQKTGIKYPLADYQLTPDMAICDSNLVLNMPATLTAFSGVDALTHALEALVSTLATEFTTPYALEAIRLIFEFLPRAYAKGADDPIAREKVHHASTLAGMAFANGFLGVCHSMAHKLGGRHHVPHGLANALLINEVIRYNAEDVPVKQGTFPQYRVHEAKARYARAAAYIGLKGNTDDEKVESLIAKIDELKKAVNIPANIKAAGVDEKSFMNTLDQLAEDAFDDQCTGANPRYPLVEELKALYLKAF